MGYTNKPFDELDVLDDFLINAIAADPEVGKAFCRKLLSVLLQREIGEISVIAQYTFPAPTPEYRGIRMDVKIEEFQDGNRTKLTNAYDLEPHLQKGIDLPRHNRFYQARSDSRHMKRGVNDFSTMPNLFVITILNFDPFGYDYMMYTIQNHCLEVEELRYEDGLKFVYFYAGGTKGGSQDIRNMLRYLQHSTADNATDASTRELHDYVSRVKTSPGTREAYMTFEEFIYYKERAIAEEVTKEVTEKVTEEVTKDTQKSTMLENIYDLLEDSGEIPLSLREFLDKIDDIDLLRKYHKAAAKADSIEAFMASIS